ncbi:MAG: nuclear transport factor 2 family protein [Niabella sp.]
MKLLYAVLLLLTSAGSIAAQSKNEKEIKAVLAKQTTAWNNGDIDTFMETYWKNDSLLFIGKKGVTYGWQPTLENYKKSYPDKAAMGTLHFTIIKISALSPVYYNVVGKWHLIRAIGDLEGHYTLLLKKIDGKWVIIQDHSS